MTPPRRRRVACPLCGTSSLQHVAPTMSAQEPPDLDSRPGEPLRSALAFMLVLCPECAYAFDPRDRAAEASPEHRTTVESHPYRAQAEALVTDAARAFLCRALLEESTGDFATAGWDTLKAAWLCEDEGATDDGVRYRLRALERWEFADQATQPLLPADEEPMVPLLIADTLRRAERWAAAIMTASSGVEELGEGGELEELLRFVAERAWWQDAEPYTVEDAAAAAVDGDPTSRRIGPLVGPGLGEYEVIHEARLPGSRLQLRRRRAGGSVWAVAEVGGAERQVSVFEAGLLILDAEEETGLDVLDATVAELEWWCGDLGWSPDLQVAPPTTDPTVYGLYREWVTAWDRLAQADAMAERDEVDAARFAAYLAECGAEAESVRAVVSTSQVPFGGFAAVFDAVIAETLRYLLEERTADSIGILETRDGYVQVLFRRDRTTIYAEAVDPGHQGYEAVSPAQLGELTRLGWIDPKTTPIPYADAQYASEWTGGNFVQELPIDLPVEKMGRRLAETLEHVYGATAGDELEVHVFEAVG